MKHKNYTRQFHKRVFVTGNIIEMYEYEKPVFKGFSKKRKGRANAPFTSDEVKTDNRAKTAQRARTTVRRTVNANPQLNKFLTLTFAENITDLDYARYEFDKFIKRLKTRFNGLQFIIVVEFQKRGAVHFHLLCNLPYIEVNSLAKIWKHGFVKINRIDNVDNVGAYITKYMTKDSIDERLAGKKCFSMSKGLKPPKEYTNEEDIEELCENLNDIKRMHSSEFETEYYGTVRYTQIVCFSPPDPPNKARRFLARFRGWLRLVPDDTPCPFF